MKQQLNLLVEGCSHCGGHHSIIFKQLLTPVEIGFEVFTHAGVCIKKGGGLVYANENDYAELVDVVDRLQADAENVRKLFRIMQRNGKQLGSVVEVDLEQMLAVSRALPKKMEAIDANQ